MNIEDKPKVKKMMIKIDIVAKEEIKTDEVKEETEEKDVIIVEEVEIEIDMVILEEIDVEVEAIVIIEIAKNVIGKINTVSVTENVIIMIGIVKEIDKEIEKEIGIGIEIMIDMIGKKEIETVEKIEISSKIDQIDQTEILIVTIHLKNIQDLNHMKKIQED